jgi:hypothetical protein
MGRFGGSRYGAVLVAVVLGGCASKPLHDPADGELGVSGAPGAGGSANPGGAVLPKPNSSVITLADGALTVHAKLEKVNERETLSCADFDFTATLQQLGGVWTLTAAAGREFASTTLVPIGSGFHTADELAIPIPNCCWTLHLQDIDLTAAKTGGGELRLLEADASGTVASDSCLGDVLEEVDVDVSLSGKADVTAPRFGLTDSAEHPLDALEMYFNEPVAKSTVATLVDADDVPATLTRLSEQQNHGAFWGYGMAPLLAFDRVMTLSSHGTDLAGNGFDWSEHFSSLPDPGVLLDAGFEGTLPSFAGESVHLVSNGAINGARSMALDLDGARATFHLKNGPDGVLRFNAQNLRWLSDLENEENGGYAFDSLATVHVEAAVVGGSKIAELTVPADDSFIVKAGDTQPQVPPVPVHAFELKLPDAGTDVIVRFTLEQTDDECGLALCGEMGALVDDLRVE